MNCDNCGANDEIAYTLKTHPATESNPATDLEPTSSEASAEPSEASEESIDLRFCSADCLQEWTTVPSATFGDEPSIRRRLRLTDQSRIVDGSR
ncbi:hypothetical protein [Halostagnicola bangensis]